LYVEFSAFFICVLKNFVQNINYADVLAEVAEIPGEFFSVLVVDNL